MSQNVTTSGQEVFASEKFSYPMIDVSLSCHGDRVYGWPAPGLLHTQWLQRMIVDEPVHLPRKKLSRRRRRLLHNIKHQLRAEGKSSRIGS
jgi:hypothetical protein